MRISTSKSEAMVLSRKSVDCLLRVGNESLPQVKDQTRSRAAAPLRGKELVEVVPVSDEDATRAPS